MGKTEVEKIEEKFSRERGLSGKIALLLSVIAISLSLFHLINGAYAGLFSMDIVRYIHLALVSCLAFFFFPFSKKRASNKLPIYDVVLAIAGLIVPLYLVFNRIALLERAATGFTMMDYFIAGMGIVLVLELTRRAASPALAIIAIITILYAGFASYIPGLLGHPGYSWKAIGEHLYLTHEGIFGIPLTVSATFVVLFIIFGAFLAKSGAAKFFIDIAFSLTGKAIGGPAKAAVVASALMGTISGSSIANVTTTGTFTIPLMKRCGYKPEFAGAVEPAASTGGQIMPPVMGAAAFIMAESLGVAYSKIMIAAIIPAIFYFFGVYQSVDLEAKKNKLRGLSKEELPNAIEVIKGGWYYVIPLIILIYLLVTGFTPMRAVVSATLSIFPILIAKPIYENLRKPYDQRQTRGQIAKQIALSFLSALRDGGRGVISLAVACAVAGIIVGVFTLTGLGFKVTEIALAASGGYLFPIIVFTAIACLILGMGVPTTANYILTSTIAAPAIITYLAAEAGLGMGEFMALYPLAALPAHMAVLYYGVAADLTPPVALAAMAGSAIAKSDPWKTAVNAFKIGIGKYLAPIVFIYYPSVLLVGADFTLSNILQTMVVLIFAFIGVMAINGGMVGYFVKRNSLLVNLIYVVSGILMIYPELIAKIVGAALFGAIVFIQRRSRKAA